MLGNLISPWAALSIARLWGTGLASSFGRQRQVGSPLGKCGLHTDLSRKREIRASAV